VFARHIEGLARLRLFDDLLRCIELRRLRRLRDVAGVQQQIRRRRKRVDLADRELQCSRDVLIRRLVESNMAVADLNKAEARSGMRMGCISTARGLGRCSKKPWT
jgi:hypothetical protein